MNDETKIPLTVIVQRLNDALNTEVGLQGLNTLLFGWIKKGYLNSATLRVRNQRDGYRWLSIRELKSFSHYAGYDLTQNRNM